MKMIKCQTKKKKKKHHPKCHKMVAIPINQRIKINFFKKTQTIPSKKKTHEKRWSKHYIGIIQTHSNEPNHLHQSKKYHEKGLSSGLFSWQVDMGLFYQNEHNYNYMDMKATLYFWDCHKVRSQVIYVFICGNAIISWWLVNQIMITISRTMHAIFHKRQ